MPIRRLRRRRLINRAVAGALLAVAGAGLAACGSPSSSLQFGIKREDLSLAFQVGSPKAVPLSALAGEPLPIPSSSFTLGELPSADQSIQLSPAELGLLKGLLWQCPSAPAGILPSEAANPFITSAPKTGVFFQHNAGTAKLTAATVTLLSLPYPHHTSLEIKNVKITSQTNYNGIQPTKSQVITYDVIEKNPVVTVSTTYQATNKELDLISTVTTSSLGTVSFHPTPAITMMQFKGVGANWTSAGIDPSTDTVMVVQGYIAKEQPVDVCGTMIDTYKVVSSEQVTNPLGNFTETTNKNDPNVYYVGTNQGGLFLSQHIDTVTTFTVKNTPYTLTQDFDSTVDSISPHPPGTPPPPPYP